MQPDPQDKLAALIHDQLSRLPDRPAPTTLVPRVLARIEQRRRQWWRRPWSQWPPAARLISLPLMVATAGGVMIALFTLVQSGLLAAGLSDLASRAAPAGPLATVWGFFQTVTNALVLALGGLDRSWFTASATVVVVMYLTCVALGTACFRVAVTKR